MAKQQHKQKQDKIKKQTPKRTYDTPYRGVMRGNGGWLQKVTLAGFGLVLLVVVALPTLNIFFPSEEQLTPPTATEGQPVTEEETLSSEQEAAQDVATDTANEIAELIVEQYDEETINSIQYAVDVNDTDSEGNPAIIAHITLQNVPGDFNVETPSNQFKERLSQLAGEWDWEESSEPLDPEAMTDYYDLFMFATEPDTVDNKVTEIRTTWMKLIPEEEDDQTLEDTYTVSITATVYSD